MTAKSWGQSQIKPFAYLRSATGFDKIALFDIMGMSTGCAFTVQCGCSSFQSLYKRKEGQQFQGEGYTGGNTAVKPEHLSSLNGETQITTYIEIEHDLFYFIFLLNYYIS